MKTIGGLCALVLTVGGFVLGAASAYAEGDGCKTYLRMYPSPITYLCAKSECTVPGEQCTFVSSPYPECACNGNYQYPFCVLEAVPAQGGGYQASCTPLLCPGTCTVAYVPGTLVAYCVCQ